MGRGRQIERLIMKTLSNKTTQGNAEGSERLAKGLGWFSIALGISEIFPPQTLGRSAGVCSGPGLFRLVGLREIINGVGILSQPRSAPWLWGRVLGDVMDLG